MSLSGKSEVERLAQISHEPSLQPAGHPAYRERRRNYSKTRVTAVSIDERRKPDPQSQLGYLRLDTHHGHENGMKDSTTSTPSMRSRGGRSLPHFRGLSDAVLESMLRQLYYVRMVQQRDLPAGTK